VPCSPANESYQSSFSLSVSRRVYQVCAEEC
jgi:hypothetical protein